MLFAPVIRQRPVARAARPAAFDRRFEQFLDDAFFGSSASRAVQAEEDDKAWTITLDVPGVSREDLSISAEGAVVRIETREQAPRRYRAVYELPQEIDVEATQAKLENGVLTLKLAKLVPVSRARQITVS